MLGVKSAKRLAGYFPHVFPASSSGLSFQTCFFSMFYHFLTCNCDKIPRRSHQKSSEYIRVTKTSGWAGLLEGDFGIHLWCLTVSVALASESCPVAHLPSLPRVGLRMVLPSSFSKMTWLGQFGRFGGEGGYWRLWKMDIAKLATQMDIFYILI